MEVTSSTASKGSAHIRVPFGWSLLEPSNRRHFISLPINHLIKIVIAFATYPIFALKLHLFDRQSLYNWLLRIILLISQWIIMTLVIYICLCIFGMHLRGIRCGDIDSNLSFTLNQCINCLIFYIFILDKGYLWNIHHFNYIDNINIIS